MIQTEDYDYLLKFIIIGNSNTGKSCLLHYFLENKCKNYKKPPKNLKKLKKTRLIPSELSLAQKFWNVVTNQSNYKYGIQQVKKDSVLFPEAIIAGLWEL